MPDDFETRARGATDLNNLARDIPAQDQRVREPRQQRGAQDLDGAVDNVDRDGAVADDDLVLPRRSVWCGFHLERGGFFCSQPGCGVGWHLFRFYFDFESG